MFQIQNRGRRNNLAELQLMSSVSIIRSFKVECLNNRVPDNGKLLKAHSLTFLKPRSIECTSCQKS